MTKKCLKERIGVQIMVKMSLKMAIINRKHRKTEKASKLYKSCKKVFQIVLKVQQKYLILHHV